MRLALKLTIALTIGITVVLGVRARVELDRELVAVEGHRRADQQLVGQTLAPTVARAWRLEGRSAALYLLRFTEHQHPRLHLRWVDLGGEAAAADRPAIAVELPDDGTPRTVVRQTELGRELFTYVPMQVGFDGEPHGALELRSPLPRRDELMVPMARREVGYVAVMGVMALLIALVVGGVGVGRPVRHLLRHIRAVGEGNFSSRLSLRRRDELGMLAHEMNRLSERLLRAHASAEQQQRARLAALEQLRQSERLATVGKLAAGVAHELGTPLNVILARAQLLDRAAPPAAADLPQHVRAQSTVIVRQTQRMARIIRGLLDFARPRRAQLQVIDLRRLIDHALTLLEPLAAKKGLRLVAQSSPHPVYAAVDTAQLQQVLTNLVVNAIQASSGGTITARAAVELRLRSGDSEPAEVACLTVTDEGPGIAPDVRQHIFEPFFTTKDVGEGTGLGLSLAYGIVQEHTGWIEVDSAPGAGASFTVCLPAFVPRPHAHAQHRPRVARNGDHRLPSSTGTVQR